MNYFAQRLKAKIEELGITAYDVANRSGIQANIVYGLVDGTRKPNAQYLRKIADSGALKLSYETLVAWMLIDRYGEDVLRQGYLGLVEVGLLPSFAQKALNKALPEIPKGGSAKQ